MSVQQGPLDLSLLQGSVAVVTGCAHKGIGWGLCKHCALLGMHVVLVDLQQAAVQAAAAELAEVYPSCRSIGIACDVSSEDAMVALVKRVSQTFPGKTLGAIFANAGVIFNRTMMRSPLSDFRVTFNVNVLGTVNTLKSFVPLAQQQSSPCIVAATASIGGLVRGDGGGAAYQGSKHALVAICESLSFELARGHPHIRVHVIAPCQVTSSLALTSLANKGEGSRQTSQVQPLNHWFAMTTEAHARQAFDKISQGLFYVVTENERPYVDHDFPFGSSGLIEERYRNMLRGQLDNSDAFGPPPHGWPTSSTATPETASPSAILKGPMFREMWRRQAAAQAREAKL